MSNFLIEEASGANGGVLRGTFNDPVSRNALSADMLAAFRDFVLKASGEAVRCIVIQGNGGHFVSGGDVKNFAQSIELPSKEREQQFEERVMASTDLFAELRNLAKPLVTITEGACAGAGNAIVLASDFVYSSEDAFFLLAHVHLGIALDIGLSFDLPRSIGLRRAKEAAMLGSKISSQEAARLGLINASYSAASLYDEAEKTIQALAKAPPAAITEIKALLNAAQSNEYEQQFALEAQAVGRCAGTDEFVERVSAFLKR